MDGFKNSTKTHYMKGGSCDGYAKGGKVKGAAKISKVMGEFKAGTLHSGSKSGPEVTSKKQATAIALSEARKAGAKISVKKQAGGMMESVSARPKDRSGRPISMEELRRSNREMGGMSKAALEAAGEAVKRGNRMAVEEGRESSLVSRKASRKAREVSMENMREYSRAEPTPPRTALDQRLSRPVSKAEMEAARRGPAGAGFSAKPLIDRVRGALGFKAGGLSTMPRGKK